MMSPSERESALRELAELDIDNLRLGRVTRQALWEASRRQGIAMGGEHILRLADEVNDMLEASREPGRRCWACGGEADGVDTDAGKRHWCVVCFEKAHRG